QFGWSALTPTTPSPASPVQFNSCNSVTPIAGIGVAVCLTAGLVITFRYIPNIFRMSAVPNSSEIASSDSPKSRRRMSTGQRILFFVTAWLIVLMPFLFWWNTWFGRQLSDKQLSEYLHDDKKPRHIQHALVQIGERMSRRDASVTRWYPDVVRLAAYP